ncbi:MAG: hypothetical protein CMC96_11755 [Flavobacteriales bacterium]|nr:hypothetical protein [Flavobacteriales bacterium]|tara:strand:+ start:11009 stop:11452 length:444 start_codon:yes stop_codon:yes gene_type:complete
MKIRYLYTFSFSEKVLFNSFSDAQLKVLEDKLKCNYAIVTKKTEEIVEFKINPFKTPNWTTMGGANRGEFYLTTNGRQNKLVYKIEFKFVFILFNLFCFTVLIIEQNIWPFPFLFLVAFAINFAIVRFINDLFFDSILKIIKTKASQ